MSPLRRRPRARTEPDSPPRPPADELALSALAEADREIIAAAQRYTMTGPSRVIALIEAVRYCLRARIPGSLVECGVWRGGSVLAMLLTLRELGVESRDVYLYDTFDGMTEPTIRDTSAYDRPATELWSESRGRPWELLFDGETNSEEAVRRALSTAGYPPGRLHFIRGPVEETLPGSAPERLALLRLDTDWYESTMHELEHLYPRLSRGGVLIIDDYGHWEGCRRAVDEYFMNKAAPVLLQRIDYTARLAIKV